MELTDREKEIVQLIRSFKALQKPGQLVVHFSPEGEPMKAYPSPAYDLTEKGKG